MRLHKCTMEKGIIYYRFHFQSHTSLSHIASSCSDPPLQSLINGCSSIAMGPGLSSGFLIKLHRVPYEILFRNVKPNHPSYHWATNSLQVSERSELSVGKGWLTMMSSNSKGASWVWPGGGNAGRFSATSMIVNPNDQISDFIEYLDPCMRSGYMKYHTTCQYTYNDTPHPDSLTAI